VTRKRAILPHQLGLESNDVAVDPAKFVREVRAEMARVTWPSRKETLVTTGLVFAMVALAAMFFFLVDQVIGMGIRALFGMSV
jgi:preprotein translocase subunit SecE